MSPLLILTTGTVLILCLLIAYAKGRYDQKQDDEQELLLRERPWHNKERIEQGWEFKAKILEKKEA